jgi:hypothetical protein
MRIFGVFILSLSKGGGLLCRGVARRAKLDTALDFFLLSFPLKELYKE